MFLEPDEATQGIFSALDGKVVEFVLQKLKNVLSVTRDSTNGGML